MRVPLGTLMQKETREEAPCSGLGHQLDPCPRAQALGLSHCHVARAIRAAPGPVTAAHMRLVPPATVPCRCEKGPGMGERAGGRGSGEQGGQIPPTAQSPGTQLR